MAKIAFVIPAYNEAVSIGQTLREIQKSFPREDIFVVNDGSKDKTGSIAKKTGVVVFTHLINRGLGASLTTGIKGALQMSSADVLITFDADLQHEAEDVHRLIKPIKEGRADAAIGSRFLDKTDLEMMPFAKVVGNYFLTGITNFFSGAKITDSQSGLRALSRKAAGKINIMSDKYAVSSEIIHELEGNKMKIVEVPIEAIYDSRSATKGTNIKSGIHIFFTILAKKIGLMDKYIRRK